MMYYNPQDPSGERLNPKNRNPWQLPDKLHYSSTYDPKTMDMLPGVQSQLAGINVDPRGMDQFREEALRSGPSAWANLSRSRQAGMARDARASAAAEVAGAGATARSTLAMRGGLDSGARERIARGGAKDRLMSSQLIGHDAAANDAQIGINDEQNRIQQLGMLPGMENTALQPAFQKLNLWGQAKQNDVKNQMTDNLGKNAFDLGQYEADMNAWGAGQTAKAQEHAADNSGSSFICTALRDDGLMSRRETALMTKFMLGGLFARADFFAWYFRHGKQAIELARRQNFDFSRIKHEYVDEILAEMEKNGVEAAQDMYIRRAGRFVMQFLGVQAGYDLSLATKNPVRALLAIPRVFSLPSTWKWAYNYFVPRAKRRTKKLFSALRAA
jgi:hypothetical protein